LQNDHLKYDDVPCQRTHGRPTIVLVHCYLNTRSRKDFRRHKMHRSS